MEILKADNTYKIKWQKIIFISGALALFVLFFVFPSFLNYLMEKQPEEGLKLLLNLFQVISLIPVLCSLFFCFYAKRIFKTGQVPPVGQKVIKDTRVYRGRPARQRALVIMIFGIVMTVVSLTWTVYFSTVLSKRIQKSNNWVNTD
jgi:Na+/melibiose symporter-like transporter